MNLRLVTKDMCAEGTRLDDVRESAGVLPITRRGDENDHVEGPENVGGRLGSRFAGYASFRAAAIMGSRGIDVSGWGIAAGGWGTAAGSSAQPQVATIGLPST